MSSERIQLCGTTLDERYRLTRRIAVGGTGVVFEGRCLVDDSAIAVKTLRPCFVGHPDLGRRLCREGEVSRRVVHPGIVRVLAEGLLEDSSPYVVMPLMQGESLADLLHRVRRLPVDELAALVMRVTSVLQSVHLEGYVHRDVKPEHVLLNRDPGGQLCVHLLDFGVCSSRRAPVEERAREEGKVFGTPTYASPEQAAGKVDIDGRADLFSLGVLMFESLSGRVPFRGASVSKLLLSIMRDDPPTLESVLPGVDPALAGLVARLLERDPLRRLPSARGLQRALMCHVGDRRVAERRLMTRLRRQVEAPAAGTGKRVPRPLVPQVA